MSLAYDYAWMLLFNSPSPLLTTIFLGSFDVTTNRHIQMQPIRGSASCLCCQVASKETVSSRTHNYPFAASNEPRCSANGSVTYSAVGRCDDDDETMLMSAFFAFFAACGSPAVSSAFERNFLLHPL